MQRRLSAFLLSLVTAQPDDVDVGFSPPTWGPDVAAGAPDDFSFDYDGCTRFLRRLDWNQNVSERAFRVKLSRVIGCHRHGEALARDAGDGRPAAFAGVHLPTVIVPTEMELFPQLPPLYFVLPVWDMVVSNMVRLSGAYDPQEIDILLRLTNPGDTFVDIGANIGAVTVPLAAHVGQAGEVHSFEPFRQVFQYLNANVATNGLANVHTHHCALSDSFAAPRLRVPAPSLQAGQNAGMYGVFKAESLETNELVSATRERMEFVDVRTLDSFDLPRADVLKIDVEGHAPRVLAGSVETLRKHRPAIWFEHSGDQAPEAMLDPALSYWCTRLADTTEDTWICVPREKQAEIWRKIM